MLMITEFCHQLFSVRKITFLSLILFLNACTIVPEREFSDYNKAFGQLQKMSEQIIIDYSVAKKERVKLDQSSQANRKSSFQSNHLIVSKIPIDDVAIRLTAWKVVEHYNRILGDLIAGKESEAETKTKSMFDSLLRLSVKALGATATQASPIAGALSAVLTQVKKGLKRREIVRSMENISPIISSGLINNMRKDSEFFYKVRFGLNNYHHQKLRKDIARHISAFIKLANIMAVDERIDIVYPMVKKMNIRLAKIAKSSTGRGFKPIRLRAKLGGSKGPVIISQLNVLKMQILMLLDKAERQNQALEAYGEMLTAYVRMLNQLDLQLKIMQQAAFSGHSEFIGVEKDFNTALIQMRQAFLYYQDSQH